MDAVGSLNPKLEGKKLQAGAKCMCSLHICLLPLNWAFHSFEIKVNGAFSFIDSLKFAIYNPKAL